MKTLNTKCIATIALFATATGVIWTLSGPGIESQPMSIEQ